MRAVEIHNVSALVRHVIHNPVDRVLVVGGIHGGRGEVGEIERVITVQRKWLWYLEDSGTYQVVTYLSHGGVRYGFGVLD